MAVLTAEELTELRATSGRGQVVTYTKPQINAALQAIEDLFQSSANIGPRSLQQALGLAIETAAPGVFGVGAKTKLFAIWCRLNARREGVLT